MRELLEVSELVGADIGPILLGIEVCEHPKAPTLCQDDGAVYVVVDPLLEHTPTQIVGLTLNDL